MTRRGNSVLCLTETAIMAAAATVLGLIKFSGFWVFGGSVSLEMLPILIMAFRRGLPWGMATGLITGVISLAFGAVIVHPVQLILDYPLPFMLVGVAGAIQLKNSQSLKKQVVLIISGALLGTSLRFLCHFLSGIIFFASYAKGPVILYSLTYNLSYLVPSFIIITVVLIALRMTAPRLFQVKGRAQSDD